MATAGNATQIVSFLIHAMLPKVAMASSGGIMGTFCQQKALPSLEIGGQFY